MIYRKVFKSNPKAHNNVWRTENLDLAQLPLTKIAYEYCKNKGILNIECNFNECDNDRLSQLIYLYLLSETCGMVVD